jgi:trimeric autotransporter adhesin
VNASLSRTFSIKERLSLEVSGQATNLFNHPEFTGGNGGLGSMNLTNNLSGGLVPGIGTSASYGSIGTGTYDPRQIVMQAIVKF